ncbi:hormogonium polysaccharide secretion pseudopilin HpsC [Anabaena sp. WFMT]|uniref:hormogonium polysaccharide secretion pseudopilin HpsC n=1 Tax=Anabaena sp. WFMT TaxID=3449730 RepID=UPI003F23F984
MLKTLKFLLKNQLKISSIPTTNDGFTMIELLVAMVIAFLILTPLLGFMVNILNTDRQEQVKANSEQEIQSALNYIARDLQQAIYIYDAEGIKTIKSQLRYPSDADKVPLLVFWKREAVNQAVEAKDGTKDDTFVYSLVSYYLIKDNSSTWSKAARIARWQIKNGVITADGVACTGYTAKYFSAETCPSAGFASFQFAEGEKIDSGMTNWKKATGVNYTANADALIDYIDSSADTAPTANCPPDSVTPSITWSKITPATLEATGNIAKMTGFYACVDKVNTTAQVFIRGNALARLDDNNTNNLNYSNSKKTYFPTANIRVAGRGYLYR